MTKRKYKRSYTIAKKKKLVTLSQDTLTKKSKEINHNCCLAAVKTNVLSNKKLREQLIKQHLKLYYNTENKKILVVGDGNCSFSSSLAQYVLVDESRLICTTFDSADILLKKYPESEIHIQKILDFGGKVFHSIDATKLQIYKELIDFSAGEQSPLFDVIVFNFPHVGLGIKDQEKNIKANQNLLKSFFLSALSCLRNDNSEIHVTLKKGFPYKKWKIQRIAESVSDKVGTAKVVTFVPEAYRNYQHRRTIGFNENLSCKFNEELNKGAHTFVFKKNANKNFRK